LAAAKTSPHQHLIDLAAAGNGDIKILDERTFELLTASHRNWSTSIHFTAQDKRRRCAPCKEFEPSWKAVAQAWATAPEESRDKHFFATLDFDDAQLVFQKIGLTSAPVVYVYHATEGPRASEKSQPFKYDFSHGFEAQPLAEQLSIHTPIPIPYKAPIDWASWGTFAGLCLLFLVTLRFIAPVLQNKWTWAAITIGVSLVMTSGYMFTRIRGAPFTSGGSWIAPGYQNQYGQETQVVAGIYALLAGSFLMLMFVTPTQMSPSKQRAQVYVWTLVIMMIFSVLISLFRVKNRGYPFKLFF
jgi:oligosaccharyltransferase complex subunit gamma